MYPYVKTDSNFLVDFRLLSKIEQGGRAVWCGIISFVLSNIKLLAADLLYSSALCICRSSLKTFLYLVLFILKLPTRYIAECSGTLGFGTEGWTKSSTAQWLQWWGLMGVHRNGQYASLSKWFLVTIIVHSLFVWLSGKNHGYLSVFS